MTEEKFRKICGILEETADTYVNLYVPIKRCLQALKNRYSEDRGADVYLFKIIAEHEMTKQQSKNFEAHIWDDDNLEVFLEKQKEMFKDMLLEDIDILKKLLNESE